MELEIRIGFILYFFPQRVGKKPNHSCPHDMWNLVASTLPLHATVSFIVLFSFLLLGLGLGCKT